LWHDVTDVWVAELVHAHKLEALVIDCCSKVSLQAAQGFTKLVHYSRNISDAFMTVGLKDCWWSGLQNFQYKFAAETIKFLSVPHWTRLCIIRPRFTSPNFILPSTFTAMILLYDSLLMNFGMHLMNATLIVATTCVLCTFVILVA
jgi:hypothetical protein